MPPTTNSARWSPTPEQLLILEEMYRGGIRTPNASQIQQITSHLSFHGKIEGKNVFYWFQNHKARDRQRLRRKLCKQLQQHQQPYQCSDQLRYQLDERNHRFLPSLDPPPSFETQPFFRNSNGSLLQEQAGMANVGLLNAETNTEKKMEFINERAEREKTTMRMYGSDWTIMKVDACPHFPVPTKPLETLQLFPIASSNLQDARSTSSNYSI